jgi:hypothetical protein
MDYSETSCLIVCFFQLKSKELLDELIELSTFNTQCLKTVGKMLFFMIKMSYTLSNKSTTCRFC